MAKKHNYWVNWRDDAAAHFKVEPPTIDSWHNPKNYTPIMLDKHNKLLDYIIEGMVKYSGYTVEVATEYVNKRRIGREQCLNI